MIVDEIPIDRLWKALVDMSVKLDVKSRVASLTYLYLSNEASFLALGLNTGFHHHR